MIMSGRIICLLMVLCGFAALVGCNEGEGIDMQVINQGDGVGPTIGNLTVADNKISIATGGILTIKCSWTSPAAVSTATGYLSFVKSLLAPPTDPSGILGSGTASAAKNLARDLLGILPATATDSTATDSTAFFTRFKDPIAIPAGIGTNRLEGYFSVQIPFPKGDISDAPVGKQQMLFWMVINGRKTNTLSFELEFSS